MSQMDTELTTVCNVLAFLEESVYPSGMVNEEGNGHYSEYGCRGLAYILSHLRGRLVHAMDGEHLNFTDGTSEAD